MLSRGFHSSAYKDLLAKQEAEDKERQDKLEELRKKKLREDIVRKREEDETRRKLKVAKEQKEQKLKEAQLEQERREKQKRIEAEEKDRKRPLSATEAKERREKADALRNASGLAKDRQSLQPSKRMTSSSYSSLLASAPTKLDAINKTSEAGSTAQSAKRSTSMMAIKDAGRASVSPKKPASTLPATSRTSASSTSVSGKNSNAMKRKLPPGTPDLEPLQKTKRDLRTIEEIQNDLHRQKGKTYAYLKSASDERSAARNKAAPEGLTASSSRSSGAASTNTATKMSSKVVDKRAPGVSNGVGAAKAGPGGESIWDILNPGKKREHYLARDIESDEDDMEANAADIRKEESRAARAAKLEDEREERAQREKEAQKAAAKRRRLEAR